MGRYSKTVTDSASLAQVFALDSGRIVWAARSAESFLAMGLGPGLSQERAAQWAQSKAGRAPKWYEDAAGLYCHALYGKAYLPAIISALVGDLTVAQDKATQDKATQETATARAAVLKLCALSPDGAVIWRRRDAATSPNTPRDKLDDFNAHRAGRALPVVGGCIKVQRQRVPVDQAVAWLQEAATGRPDLSETYVLAAARGGKTAQEVATLLLGAGCFPPETTQEAATRYVLDVLENSDE